VSCQQSERVQPADLFRIRSRESSGWEGEDALGAEERDALLKEHRTWQLFRAVYRYVKRHRQEGQC
jgi:hypothetical protein